MIFKIIFTDQHNRLSDFIIISESIDDAVDELNSIFDGSIVKEKDAKNRAVLFGIENFGGEENPENFLRHVSDPENARLLEKWFLGPVEGYEDNFMEYHRGRSLMNTLSD